MALATMLLPVAAVAGAGLVTFRLSISALEGFREETVEESKRIEEAQSQSRRLKRMYRPPDSTTSSATEARNPDRWANPG
jgi:hypothetical protein